ncbi:transposase [Streptomyces mirabilis]|uniref:transposase n=1 Tax=Streptomyces mirabilis TaxID=68239 RepID=UPI0033B433E4
MPRSLAIGIRKVLGALFTDEDFAGAFPDRGRPAISPGALASVSVPQYAEGLCDRHGADHVRARMDWTFLSGLELDDPGFDFTVLGDFSSRLHARAGRASPGGGAGPAAGGRAAASQWPAAHRFHACAGCCAR